MGNYCLYRIGQFFLKILPIHVSNALVMFLCDLHFYFSRADRQAVGDNLKIVHNGDHVPYQEVRKVFRNFGKSLLEFFTMTRRLEPAFIESNVHIKNIEYFNEVLKKGKGGILVTAHLGNWEMGGIVLPALGLPLSVVALAHKDPRVNALFNKQREAFGALVIQTDMAVRHVVRHLKRNRLIAILADRDFGNNGIVMDFLGHQTMIPKGAAFFSMKTGAPIIPAFFLRTDDDHFEIKVYPPIEPPPVRTGKIADEAARGYIQKYLTIIEDEIRKSASQWLLFREFGLP
jgi:lauroyl/myristoyl acyltransferase